MDHDFRNRELRFSIYGLVGSYEPQSFVAAEVFSKTVRAVIAALKEADKKVNSDKAHKYVISHLKLGSAEVGLLERPALPAAAPLISSISAFTDCAEAIHRGDYASAAKYGELGNRLQALSMDAGSRYSHIDFSVDSVPTLRVDNFFARQVEEVIAKTKAEALKAQPAGFSGTSVDAFDGYLKEVDLRGRIWRGKLIVAGTSKEIDCEFQGPTLDDISTYLDRRVWAEGLAIYRAESGHPSRLVINRLCSIRENGDLSRWRGKLTSEPGSEWGGVFDDFDE